MLNKVEKRKLRNLEVVALTAMLTSCWRRYHGMEKPELEQFKAGLSPLDAEIVETMMRCTEHQLGNVAISFVNSQRGI